MKNQFKEGDPIIVIGNICSVRTLVGLYGYITKIFTEKEAGGPGKPCISVEVFQNPDLPGHKPKFGHDWTACAIARPEDLVPMARSTISAFDKKLLRVEALKAKKQKENTERDPEEEKKLNDVVNSAIQRSKAVKARDKKVVAASKKMGQVFPRSGYVKRGDKSHFICYRSAEVQVADDEIRRYAVRENNKWTIKELARWTQARALVDESSFWSDCKECRDVVKEFDLDPYIDQFNNALRHQESRIYAKSGELRNKVLHLWNKSAEILSIEAMKDEDTSWGFPDKGEPTGFSIHYAFRRVIPIERFLHAHES